MEVYGALKLLPPGVSEDVPLNSSSSERYVEASSQPPPVVPDDFLRANDHKGNKAHSTGRIPGSRSGCTQEGTTGKVPSSTCLPLTADFPRPISAPPDIGAINASTLFAFPPSETAGCVQLLLNDIRYDEEYAEFYRRHVHDNPNLPKPLEERISLLDLVRRRGSPGVMSGASDLGGNLLMMCAKNDDTGSSQRLSRGPSLANAAAALLSDDNLNADRNVSDSYEDVGEDGPGTDVVAVAAAAAAAVAAANVATAGCQSQSCIDCAISSSRQQSPGGRAQHAPRCASDKPSCTSSDRTAQGAAALVGSGVGACVGSWSGQCAGKPEIGGTLACHMGQFTEEPQANRVDYDGAATCPSTSVGDASVYPLDTSFSLPQPKSTVAAASLLQSSRVTRLDSPMRVITGRPQGLRMPHGMMPVLSPLQAAATLTPACIGGGGDLSPPVNDFARDACLMHAAAMQPSNMLAGCSDPPLWSRDHDRVSASIAASCSPGSSPYVDAGPVWLHCAPGIAPLGAQEGMRPHQFCGHGGSACGIRTHYGNGDSEDGDGASQAPCASCCEFDASQMSNNNDLQCEQAGMTSSKSTRASFSFQNSHNTEASDSSAGHRGTKCATCHTHGGGRGGFGSSRRCVQGCHDKGSCDVLRGDDEAIFLRAKDQNGCRHLQRRLVEGTREERLRIFRVAQMHLVELMMDSYGNYLIQKLLEVCEVDQLHQLLDAAKLRLKEVCLDAHGTRTAQKLVEVICGHRGCRPLMTALVEAFRPLIIKLSTDANGNHVIQRFLACCDGKEGSCNADFIIEVACVHFVEIATERHGCCVLQRCCDAATGALKERLLEELVCNALVLIQDQFGNYVVQHLLRTEHRRVSVRILEQMRGHVCQLSLQKFASNVVELCLVLGDAAQRSQLVGERLADPRQLQQLVIHAYGNYVVQRALSVAKGQQLKALHGILGPGLMRQNSSQQTTRITQRILKKFPALQQHCRCTCNSVTMCCPKKSASTTLARGFVDQDDQLQETVQSAVLAHTRETCKLARGKKMCDRPEWQHH